MERRKNLNDKFGFAVVMKYNLLKDIAEITMGQSPDSLSYNNVKRGLPFYQGNGDFGELYPIAKTWCDAPKKTAKKNDILISVRAPIGAINYTSEFCCIGRGLAAITVEDDIDRNYIYYFLKAKNSELINQGTGSTFKAIGRPVLEMLKVPAISEKQKILIIKSMDFLVDIIKLRKKELILLDELIKARFIEMFGTLDDPADEFEKATLKKLCNKITDGKHGGCTSEEGTQRYFVGAREIYDDEVHYDTAPEINVEEFEKDYKRCNIEIGDFLIVNTGATIGKSAIASDERTEHTLLQKSVALLKIKKDKLNPVFLKWCYRVNTRMYMVQSASAQPNLLLSKINGTVIYVPSIERQNQFADFVQQVDKSREEVKKSLEKTQQLYDSLMQEYFG